MTKNSVDLTELADSIVIAGDRVAEDVRRLRESRAALRALIQAGHAAGINDVQLARLSGVIRVTVREWTGRGSSTRSRALSGRAVGQTSIT